MILDFRWGARENAQAQMLLVAQVVRAPQAGNPIQFSRSRIEYRSAPPMLGEHTEQVLGELLGVTPGEIASLRDRDIV